MPVDDPNILVGTSTRDDAAVYRLNDDQALVVTTDFFTPVVDDAFDFGRIAAANALSDVYAMGARPTLALNLVGFPARTLPMEILGRIMDGGSAVAREAGVPILGGHSIDDPEPKYGLVAVGLVHPDALWRNDGARDGDVLILTKPLGSGVLTTAVKRGAASDAELREVTELMATLNRIGAEVLLRRPGTVHGATDVTGYGLFGHLLEMMDGAGLRAELSVAAIPILAAARAHAAEGIYPGGSAANLDAARPRVHTHDPIDEVTLRLLADAQTSGGLLAAVDPAVADEVIAELEAAGTLAAARIGRVKAGEPGITLRA